MSAFEELWPFTKPEKSVSNQKKAAEKNRVNILGLIARRRCLSQRQLTVATGLRASTIYNIVSELKQQGLIREGASLKAERSGPKETELEIVPDYLWCAGISLSINGHSLTIIDACGQTLAEETIPFGQEKSSGFLPLLCERILANGAKAGLDRQRLGGVCLSVPGVVSASDGSILYSDSLQLESFQIRKPMEKLLGCPVWVERDLVCAAYAEHTIGAADGMESFIYLYMRSHRNRHPHPGMSLVINEKVFRGDNSAAGEIGRIFISNDKSSTLLEEAITPENTERYYTALALALANIINLLDMRYIVLASNDKLLTAERFETLKQVTRDNLVPVASRKFDIKRSQLGIEGVPAGRSLLALHRGLAARLGENW